MDFILDVDIVVVVLVFFGMVDVKDILIKYGFSSEMVNNIRVVCVRYFSKVFKEFIFIFIVDGILYERYFVDI